MTRCVAGHRQVRGAALIAAMLTLTMVATLSGAAAWYQWRAVEVERVERSRMQAAWLLIGALDWSRLILREDARTGGADHGGEPWAVVLQESRLSSFLAAGSVNGQLLADQSSDDVFLSGQIQDLQGRFNLFNLIENGSVVASQRDVLAKLFDLQGIDRAELDALVDKLTQALSNNPQDKQSGSAPLLPMRVDHLVWLGLPSASVERLRPHITWLPERTPLNVNTASAELLYAAFSGIKMDEARRLVTQRAQQHFTSLAQLSAALPSSVAPPSAALHGVASRYFEITGRLRIADAEQSWVVTERSVVRRNGISVQPLWRERGGFVLASGGKTFEEINAAQR